MPTPDYPASTRCSVTAAAFKNARRLLKPLAVESSLAFSLCQNPNSYRMSRWHKGAQFGSFIAGNVSMEMGLRLDVIEDCTGLGKQFGETAVSKLPRF